MILSTALRVVGIAAFGAVQAAWWQQDLPPLLRALHLGLLALALARPAWALLVFAGLAPLAASIRYATGTPLDAGWIFEQMALAVITGGLVRWPPIAGRLRLAAPALLCGSVALASMLAVTPAVAAAFDPGVTVSARLVNLWHGEYFGRTPVWEPLFFATLIVVGASLAVVVERLCRRDAWLTRAVVRMAVWGSTGAALVNLWMLLREAWRTGQSFPSLFVGMRLNYGYDLNAGGPVFLLVLVSGAALLADRGRARLVTAVALLLLMAALWGTGSRVALAALPVVVGATLVVAAVGQRGRARWIALAAISVVLSASAVMAIYYPAARNQAVSGAVHTRVIMARTSWAMIRSAPVFGIGVGRFSQESPAFGATELLQVVGVHRDHENAHNNFLQVFAEEGLVGFTALLILLVTLGVGVAKAPRDDTRWLRYWLFAGVVGFVLTWLTSHPMLVRQAALTFWLFAGLLAAVTPAPSTSRFSIVPWVCAALVLATAPVRADLHLRNAVLEYRGIGVSLWQHEGALRYREAGVRFSLYLPADGSPYLLPVRRAPGAPAELRLRMSAEGHLLNEVVLAGDDWLPLSFQVPAQRRRYLLVDFAVEAPNATAPLPAVVVHVGKETAR